MKNKFIKYRSKSTGIIYDVTGPLSAWGRPMIWHYFGILRNEKIELITGKALLRMFEKVENFTQEKNPLEAAEKKVIEEHLIKNNFNKTKTKKDLGITFSTLNVKIKKYNLGVMNKRLGEENAQIQNR